MSTLYKEELESILPQLIKNALEEDIKTVDITTAATIPFGLKGKGTFLVKGEGVIAGLFVAKRVMEMVDASLDFSIHIKEGSKVKHGDVAAIVEGNVASILTAERTALNFLQRISGIASMSAFFQDKISHTKAKVIDTRKTVPGLRLLDKYAVQAGGAGNHRIGLYDMFLIKDNHIAVSGSITKAVNACREYCKLTKKDFKIEVETENLQDVQEALDCKVDMIMLDNFNIEEMKKAVELINGQCKIEASGNVNINTVVEIAETGVDFISVGAFTHSVKALDISLDVVNL